MNWCLLTRNCSGSMLHLSPIFPIAVQADSGFEVLKQVQLLCRRNISCAQQRIAMGSSLISNSHILSSLVMYLVIMKASSSLCWYEQGVMQICIVQTLSDCQCKLFRLILAFYKDRLIIKGKILV